MMCVGMDYEVTLARNSCLGMYIHGVTQYFLRYVLMLTFTWPTVEMSTYVQVRTNELITEFFIMYLPT
jgi:hypothetical protein